MFRAFQLTLDYLQRTVFFLTITVIEIVTVVILINLIPLDPTKLFFSSLAGGTEAVKIKFLITRARFN